MSKRTDTAVTPALAALLERINQWRRTRAKLSPMPEELWAAAAEVARADGVSAVAAAAGLGYTPLKRRTEAGCNPRAGASARDGFVEFTGAELLCADATPGPVVELWRPDGLRLVIRGGGGTSVDLDAVVTAFGRLPR